VCLDVGGPKEIATSECGLLLKTSDLEFDDFVNQAADRITSLFQNKTAMNAMSIAALERAKQYIWNKRVSALYTDLVGKWLSVAR